MTETATVSKEQTFDMAHRLMKHEGACKNIHGHTYKIKVDVTGKIDDKGMVIDFAVLKRVMSHVVDNYFDHAICLNDADEKILKFVVSQDLKVVSVPFEPTAENLANYFKEHIFSILEETPYGKTITQLTVTIWETPTSYAVSSN